MVFCRNCGTAHEDGARFCISCGTSMEQPVQNGNMNYQQMVYVKPKRPGRGFGISSMVLGIIGLFYGLAFAATASEGEFVPVAAVFIFSSLSIMAICFSIVGRARGYKNGVSVSGLVMGMIGMFFYFLAMISSFVM